MGEFNCFDIISWTVSYFQICWPTPFYCWLHPIILEFIEFILSATLSWHCSHHWKCHLRAFVGTSSVPEMHMDTLENSLYKWLFCVIPRLLLCSVLSSAPIWNPSNECALRRSFWLRVEIPAAVGQQAQQTLWGHLLILNVCSHAVSDRTCRGPRKAKPVISSAATAASSRFTSQSN